MNNENQDFLSTIDLITDVTLSKPHTTGTIFLTSNKESFFIHWVPFDGTPTQQITTIFQSTPSITTDEWLPNKPFLMQCNDFTYIELQHKKNILLLIFHHVKFKESRKFIVKLSEYVSVIRFIEQLLINGIAVPSAKSKYCFKIYKNCKKDTFSFIPSYIKLQDFHFKGMNNFWAKVNSFYESFLSQLDRSGTFPSDPDFPLNESARSSHNIFFSRVKSEISNIPNYEKITSENFLSLFDSDGRVTDRDLFRKRLYHSGVDSNEILIKILPFALGIYPFDSTFSDRSRIDSELLSQYKILRKQNESVQDIQRKNSKRISEVYKVIGKDVFRTDRQMNTFKNPNGVGSQLLTSYLQMYSVQLNPNLGYLQGMNDLFVPIIQAYLPEWSEDSSPVISQDELDELKQKLNTNEFNEESLLKNSDLNEVYLSFVSSKIFWCFDSMLKMTNQFALLANVTDYCHGVADTVHEILSEFSPLAATWMRHSGIKDIVWIYGDFVMMFKRTFPSDIWSLWLQFFCSPNPTRWMSYFTCAIIVASFDQLSCLPDVQLNSMMEAFPKILKGLDMREIGEIAMWLSMAHPIAPIHSNEEIHKNVKTDFKFFRTFSTNKWPAIRNDEIERKGNEDIILNYKESYEKKSDEKEAEMLSLESEDGEPDAKEFGSNKLTDENTAKEASSEGIGKQDSLFFILENEEGKIEEDEGKNSARLETEENKRKSEGGELKSSEDAKTCESKNEGDEMLKVHQESSSNSFKLELEGIESKNKEEDKKDNDEKEDSSKLEIEANENKNDESNKEVITSSSSNFKLEDNESKNDDGNHEDSNNDDSFKFKLEDSENKDDKSKPEDSNNNDSFKFELDGSESKSNDESKPEDSINDESKPEDSTNESKPEDSSNYDSFKFELENDEFKNIDIPKPENASNDSFKLELDVSESKSNDESKPEDSNNDNSFKLELEESDNKNDETKVEDGEAAINASPVEPDSASAKADGGNADQIADPEFKAAVDTSLNAPDASEDVKGEDEFTFELENENDDEQDNSDKKESQE